MKKRWIASVLGVLALAGTATLLTSCDEEVVTPPENEVLKYIINFHSNGGSAVSNQEINQNGLISKPADPSKNGYIFAGWYQDSGCQVSWNFESDIVTSNITLYAKWMLEETVVVRFNSKGGTVVSGKSLQAGVKLEQPENPTRPGYTFAGWYQDEECTDAWNFDTDIVSDNLTLYAKWIPKGDTPVVEKFTVTFNSDGGSEVTALTEVAKGSKISKPTDPTKEGHTFDYWVKEDGSAWNFDTDTVTANITLKAVWVEDGGDTPVDRYTVTFNSDGGSTVEALTNVASGSKISKPADPTKEGHTFDKWVKEDGSAWNFDTDTVTSNITLKATWTKNDTPQPVEKYTVTFDSAGGSAVTAISNITSGSKITAPTAPTKSGYIFEGWLKSDGSVWKFNEDVVTSNIILTAKWTKESVTPSVETVIVSFNSAGGTSIADRKADKNTPISQPLDPERPGYEFLGWFTAQNSKWDFNQNVTGNMTLTAQWKELTFNISFDINGHGGSGIGDKVNLAFIPDDLPTLSDSSLIFAGWYLDEALEEAAVVGTKLTQNITLYAKWITANDINITESMGHLESAYLEWDKQQGISDYNVYYKKKDTLDSTYVKIDKPLIREYSNNYRADVIGLAAGDYTLKVEAVANGNAGTSATRNVSVLAHERSGFAFSKNSKYKTASGAYNDDGTLKSNAVVVYVTAGNAKNVSATLDINGTPTEAAGIQNILNLKQKKNSTQPLCIRIIGTITGSDVDSFGSSSQGLQIKGASAFSDLNVTFEGVGEDAVISGFGVLARNCGNVEFRNFAIMNQMDDGISIDTDNCNIWVHNLDIYYGKQGSGDKAKGDGSVDTKQSTNITIAYNHFWDSGKCNLQGMKSETTENYITYHHNWYDHSDSRHPRIRTCTVHIYNNYFDGNAKYGVGMTSGGSAFVENNFFRNCKNPMMISLQGTDAAGDKGTFSGESGGIIKAYGNHIEGGNDTKVISYQENNSSFDAYIASSRDEKVPSNVKSLFGSSTYNNFDTNSSIMYTYSVDTAEEAKAKVMTYAGRINGGDLKWTFDNATQDRNYDLIPELQKAVLNYKSSLVRVLGL